MNVQRKLYDHEAEYLGKSPNKKEPGKNQAPYRLKKKEWEQVVRLRATLKGRSKKQATDPELKTKSISTTVPNDYIEAPKFYLSALDKEKGTILSIDEFCDKYNLNKAHVSSFKFLPHHYAEPSYNIVFKPISMDNDLDWDAVKKILSKEIKKEYVYKERNFNFEVENVLKWSDLHFGAAIKNILLVKDYNKDILLDGLLESVSDINAIGFKKTHIHINGDLIESFSGLNHINSWQSMDPELIGAKVVRLCSQMLHTALSKVNNLGCVKIVAGNHDRLSKNNDEDVKGGAADLIAYSLELMGYDVEFHPYVITHLVEGINHINLHGHTGISKRSTEKIILDYGIQGVYNLINEGHLHSVIEKLSVKQREKFELVKDDGLMHRRFYLPSFFPGNFYSATLGYTTNPGYFSIWNKGNNRPQFFNGSV